MFMASLILHLILAFPLVSLFYFLSSDIYYILLHIAPHLLLPTLLFFTFIHVLLLVYCGVTGLSLPLTLYSLVHIHFSLLTLNLLLSAIFLLTVLLLLLSLFFYYSNYLFVFTPSYLYFILYLPLVLLLLFQINYKSIVL